MAIWKGSGWSPDWSDDFFEAGRLQYDAERDARIVKDTEYCIDYAMDWKNGVGDFYSDESTIDPEDRLVDVTEIGG